MSTVSQLISTYSREAEEQVIQWRRDFHRHPEPGNYEFRTAKTVADILRVWAWTRSWRASAAVPVCWG